jgi:hypothetical protein
MDNEGLIGLGIAIVVGTCIGAIYDLVLCVFFSAFFITLNTPVSSQASAYTIILLAGELSGIGTYYKLFGNMGSA